MGVANFLDSVMLGEGTGVLLIVLTEDSVLGEFAGVELRELGERDVITGGLREGALESVDCDSVTTGDVNAVGEEGIVSVFEFKSVTVLRLEVAAREDTNRAEDTVGEPEGDTLRTEAICTSEVVGERDTPEDKLKVPKGEEVSERESVFGLLTLNDCDRAENVRGNVSEAETEALGVLAVFGVAVILIESVLEPETLRESVRVGVLVLITEALESFGPVGDCDWDDDSEGLGDCVIVCDNEINSEERVRDSEVLSDGELEDPAEAMRDSVTVCNWEFDGDVEALSDGELEDPAEAMTDSASLSASTSPSNSQLQTATESQIGRAHV